MIYLWDAILTWFANAFGPIEDEPLDIDLKRDWPEYLRMAEHFMSNYQQGRWGEVLASELIRGYLFQCWMEDIDYFTAVKALEEKITRVS